MSFDVDAAAARLARLRETWCSTDEFYPFTTADEQRSVHGDREDAMNLLAQALDVIREQRQELDARIGQANRLSFLVERTQRQRDQLWRDLVDERARSIRSRDEYLDGPES